MPDLRVTWNLKGGDVNSKKSQTGYIKIGNINDDFENKLAKELSSEFDYEKAMKLSKDLKQPKAIENKLKKEGEIGIMAGSEPYGQGEKERVLSVASAKYTKDGKLKGNITEEIFNEADDKYYTHKIYSKNGKIKMKKQVSKDETIFD